MVTILLANGFEVAEALVTLDLLHRAGVEACLTGLHSGEVLSANGIHVKMDRVLPEVGEEAFLSDLEMLILAGGMDNTIELTCSAQAKRVIAGAVDKGLQGGRHLRRAGDFGGHGSAGRPEGGLLPRHGRLYGRPLTSRWAARWWWTATSSPAQGPGAAFDFALKLVEVLKGQAVMEQVKEEIHYQ